MEFFDYDQKLFKEMDVNEKLDIWRNSICEEEKVKAIRIHGRNLNDDAIFQLCVNLLGLIDTEQFNEDQHEEFRLIVDQLFPE